MGFVHVGANDMGMVPLGASLRQLAAQPVRLRCNLTRNKGLAKMVGNHIILATNTARLFEILLLVEQKLRIRNLAVTLTTGNPLAMVFPPFQLGWDL